MKKVSEGDHDAHATYDDYGHVTPDAYERGDWLPRVVDKLDAPLCDDGFPEPCRYAAEPWPWNQSADAVWHEASHTHHYGHGDNTDNNTARAACGYLCTCVRDPWSPTITWRKLGKPSSARKIAACRNGTLSRCGKGNPDEDFYLEHTQRWDTLLHCDGSTLVE